MRVRQGSGSSFSHRRRIALGVTVGALTAGTGVAIAAGSGEPVSAEAPIVVNGSFVSPLGERFGDVRVGRGVFVAGNTTLRADPGHRVSLGDRTNVQDNVSVLALGGEPGPSVASTGARTSLAHQAEVVNSKIGAFTFIGFRARIVDSTLADGAFIGHGAVVQGVKIPKDRFVGVGQVVTTQAQANALPKKTDGDADFQRDVLEVNHEFAEEYADLYHDHGYRSVTGISRSPKTSFNPGKSPTIGAKFVAQPSARIVGDVRIGDNAKVGRRTSVRADEGSPISIGAGAAIEDRVTFHALKGTSITIGAGLDTDDNVVFHGPLTVGDRLTIDDDAILFRSVVGNDVTIEEGAIVVGPASAPLQLHDGLKVPAGTVLTSQAQVDALG
jgi:carbonic anhydrase/acetyltransferase-like protein (isoleucine patch superfamily)